MSLVVGYASHKKSLLMSDGRASGVLATEYCNKTLKIKDHTIAGFVGYLEEAEIVLKDLKSKNFIGIDSSDDFVEFIEWQLSYKPDDISFNSTFCAIGFDRQHILSTYFIGDITSYKIEKHTVQQSEPRIMLMGGSAPPEKINTIFMDNIKNHSLTPEDRLRKTIMMVSEIDNSVNKNCYMQTLK